MPDSIEYVARPSVRSAAPPIWHLRGKDATTACGWHIARPATLTVAGPTPPARYCAACASSVPSLATWRDMTVPDA